MVAPTESGARVVGFWFRLAKPYAPDPSKWSVYGARHLPHANMKLSRTVMYALQAVCQLGAAGQQEPVPSKKIAESGDMPDRFLLQILRNLVAHGLLRSTRGVIGGYTLARSPEEISLLDIIEAVEGPVTFELADASPEQTCLRKALETVTTNVRRDLAELKLSQLLQDEPQEHGVA